MRSQHSILLIGNFCHDVLIERGGRRHHTLGSSVAYASSVLRPLGLPYRVVANVGEDFLYYKDLGSPRELPRVVPGTRTTTFVNDHTSGERRGTLRNAGEPLRPADLGSDPVEIGVACGVAGEVLPETLLRLRELSRTVVCDVQALIRTFDADTGEVRHRPLEDTPFGAISHTIDYLKVSEAEAPFVNIPRLCNEGCTVLLTRGELGCTIVSNRRTLTLPAWPAREEDPTGAGDCFLAGFAAGLLLDYTLEHTGRLANYCGALAVEEVGVPTLTHEHFHSFSREPANSLAIETAPLFAVNCE